MKKRILALLLALCMLAAPHVSAADQPERTPVVYIPLDNRPFNDEQVRAMAASLNIELIMPPEDLFSTRLDGQPRNENGTQSGDREALFSWLQEQDAEYDTFILSLDQLLSGGLMNSRTMDQFEDLTFEDGRAMTEYEVIDYLETLAGQNTVYIIDSVMRLAVSSEYDGFNLIHYNLFRRYGLVPRPELSGEDLTPEQIEAAYSLYEDSATPAFFRAGFSSYELSVLLSPKDSTSGMVVSSRLLDAFLQRQETAHITDGQAKVSEDAPVKQSADSLLSSYLRTRSRKLRLTDYAMTRLCPLENVHYLLGIDDSSEGNNIQSNEIALFRSRLSGHSGHIFSSLDGLGQTALSQVFLDTYPCTPDVSVSYLGDQTDCTLDFNCYTTREMVDATLSYYGCNQVTEDPDLSVVVVTEADANSSIMLCRLVSLLNENEAAQIPTILVDLTSNREPELDQMLVENTHLGMLLSYSGSVELPSGIIMAMSQGIARYASLAVPGLLSAQAQTAHLQNLSTALIREFAFGDSAKAEMGLLLDDMGISRTNFGTIGEDTLHFLQDTLTQKVTDASTTLTDNLSSSSFISGLGPYTTGGIQSVAASACTYPWLRQMEIDFVVDVQWSEDAHDPGTFHRAYIDGTSETGFSPGSSITREAAAKMLVGAVGLPVDTPAENIPADVSGWAKPYVGAALENGYLKGYPDGAFHGSRSMTRAEFAAMLLQYAQAEQIVLPEEQDVTFTDVTPDSTAWYVTAVYTLSRAGIICGDAVGTFRPLSPIKRVEAVTMLNRLFDRGADRDEPLSDSLSTQLRFADVTQAWQIVQIQEASISHFSG